MVCDLAINEGDEDRVAEELRRLVSSGGTVSYIDHHPIPTGFRPEALKGVRLVQSLEASASELAYRLFKDLAGRESIFLALYGAIGDYAEGTVFIQEELNRWERRVVYLESGLLVQALTQRRDDKFRIELVEQLAQGRRPSELPEVVEQAVKGLRSEYEVYEYTKSFTQTRGCLSVIAQLPVRGFGGKAATYAAAFTGAKVGVAVSYKDGEADLSLRTRDPSINLNELLRRLAKHVGGYGGGHRGAAGAQVPADRVEDFLALLEASIGS